MSCSDYLFESPKGEKENCLMCTEPTKFYLDCCQKPICPGCFNRWHFDGKSKQGRCCHCRTSLFEVEEEASKIGLSPAVSVEINIICNPDCESCLRMRRILEQLTL